RMVARVIEQRTARDRQQRPPQGMFAKAAVRGHRRQAIDAGSAQGPQQECLGLVVLMLRQCERFAVAQLGRECGASRQSRGTLGAQACAVLDLHAMHDQLNAPGVALLLAVQHPPIRIGLQAVVHVHRAQRSAGSLRAAPQPMQQHGGVDTTAVAHQQRRIQRNEGREGSHGGKYRVARQGCALHPQRRKQQQRPKQQQKRGS
ncbi:hypothetical protein BFJ72_g15412, partial [Fusarium proliferatum]